MSLTSLSTGGPAPITRNAPNRRWGLAHIMALGAIPVVVWETWTVIAWASDNPHQITSFRDRTSASWYAAHTVEGLLVVMSVAVLVNLVGGCLRQGRFFTFDVMFCLCASTLVWGDAGPNFLQPVFFGSSNWINVNSMCGHMPLVVNPDCGRLADPIVFNILLETFGLLGLAIVFGAIIGRIRRRWPGISTMQTFGIIIASGLLLDLIIEPLVFIPLHLWSYGNSPLSIPIGGLHFPYIEIFAGGLFMALPVALRVFKDDRGLTLVERGLERHSPRLRTGITMLALYGFFQLAMWPVASAPLWTVGLYARSLPELPAHIVNGLCDAPGWHGTRYGPCPGSRGYRMPGRHSLPGTSP